MQGVVAVDVSRRKQHTSIVNSYKSPTEVIGTYNPPPIIEQTSISAAITSSSIKTFVAV